MVDSITGKPLIIGNSIATPNADGTVKIKTQTGETNVSLEKFKKYLIENAPKIQAGDTVSFKGDEGGETSGSIGRLKYPHDIIKQDFNKKTSLGWGAFMGYLGGSALHATNNYKEIGNFAKETKILENPEAFTKNYKAIFEKFGKPNLKYAAVGALIGVALTYVVNKLTAKE